ncbi:lipid kinase, YegS/Rv2252/BmrU family [Prevotella sp. KH2C16]|nr:lipid kinase, YegS/Rv2252/BmrU family [Prevotella sp. KH2C16]
MNPISGTTSKSGVPRLIDKYLDKEKFDFEIKSTDYAGHGVELAKEAVARGVDIVVAVGGDGTVNEVARSLVHTKTALGILPCGSGNGLARHLMLPMNLRKSIEIINLCEIHDLDYGIINGHPFFCTCGMGFDADISQKFAESGKRGPITYVQKVLEEGLKYRPQTYEIEFDGDTTRYKAFLISCANASQYGNNAYIAPQASMSDGMMDVIIMEPFDLLEASQIAIDMFNKTLDKSSRIKSFRAKHLKIHRAVPGVIHFDGDPVITSADVDVRLFEKGFKAVVNPDANKDFRKPNMLQSAAAELFNEINVVKDDISRQGRHVLALSKILHRKLNL